MVRVSRIKMAIVTATTVIAAMELLSIKNASKVLISGESRNRYLS